MDALDSMGIGGYGGSQLRMQLGIFTRGSNILVGYYYFVQLIYRSMGVDIILPA